MQYIIGTLGEDGGVPLEALIHWEYSTLFKGENSLMRRLVKEDGSKLLNVHCIVVLRWLFCCNEAYVYQFHSFVSCPLNTHEHEPPAGGYYYKPIVMKQLY